MKQEDLPSLIKRVHDNAVKHGWHDQIGNTEFNSAFPYIHIKNLWRAIGFFLIFIGLCIFETSAYHRGVKDGEQEVINILKENEE